MTDKETIRDGKRQIRRVFMEDWDPIGIRHEPNAQDEYDGYLGGVYDLLAREASEAEVVDYLHWVEADRMGMASDWARLVPVAQRLRRLNIHLAG